MRANAGYGHRSAPIRIVSIAVGITVLTAAAATAAVLAASPSKPAVAVGRSPGPTRSVASPACPPNDRAAVDSTRPGAESTVVPDGATGLLLCRYGPGAARIVRERTINSSSEISQLAAELNALPPATGAYSCPSDDGETIVADFSYADGPPDPVNVELEGCGLVSNGHVNRIGDGEPVIGRLEALIRWLGTIKGRVELCGGAYPGGCRLAIHADRICNGSKCLTANAVSIMHRQGAQYAPAKLRSGRFSARVEPGRYKLALLAERRNAAPKVLASARARVRFDRVSRVVFRISVK